MRRVLAVAVLLLAPGAWAQKPWETRVDLPVRVPVELPAVPPTNPFATTLASPPALLQAPLREKFNLIVPVQGAAYVDGAGTCRRVVFTALALPGVGSELQPAVLETEFSPARALGQPVAGWVGFSFDLSGRLREGRAVRLIAVAAPPGPPPVPEVATPPVPDARDLALPSTPVQQLDQFPAARRFRARLASRTWTQRVRLLAEVMPEGRCSRIVFLSCPEGLRQWLLASISSWTFQPGRSATGPVPAWAQVDGEIEVDTAALTSESLRVSRQPAYPRAPAAPAAVPPPGA